MEDSVLVELLNKQLADTIDLRSQVRQAEFNITSPYGEELKELFDGLAHDLQIIGDLIAGSIRDLGGVAMGTVRLVAGETELQAYPLDATDVRDHLNALLSSHSRYALETRQNLKSSLEIEGSDISRMYEIVLTSIESNLWFLEAYLEGIAVGNQGGTLPRWHSAFRKPPGPDQNNAIKPSLRR